jgi:outer membrane protein TolC
MPGALPFPDETALETTVPYVAVRYFRSVALLAPACLILQTSVYAEAATLNFDQALAFARERSLQLVAERAAQTAAEELAISAGQRPDPVLMAGIDNFPVSGVDAFEVTRDFMTMRSVGIEFELTRGDRRSARTARYAAEAAAAAATEAVSLAALERGTASAWLNCYFQEEAQRTLQRTRAQTLLQVEAADVAFRSGLGTESEAFAARLAVAQLDDRIVSTERDIALARVRLARWVGEPASGPLGGLPAMDSAGPHGTDVDAALLQHPELERLAKEAELARAKAEIARTDQRSDWTIGFMYEQRSPDFSNMLSVRASKPLRLNKRDRQNRELSGQLALARRASAVLEEETRMHRAESEALVVAWRANRTRLDRFETELLPLARRRGEAAAAAYRAGNGTLESVLTARIAELDVELDRIALATETALTWAELHYLVPSGNAHE